MTCCCHALTVSWNKCDIVSVNKLDVDIMDYLEQLCDLLLPWTDCVMEQV